MVSGFFAFCEVELRAEVRGIIAPVKVSTTVSRTGGLIARFRNATNAAVTPTLQLARPISRAWQTTRIETNERALPLTKGNLSVPFMPGQLNTYRPQSQR